MVARTRQERALWPLLVLACLLGLAARTRAQDVHECRDTRSVCDAHILETCPGGADVIDEQALLPDEEHVARYLTMYRCRPAPVAQPVPVPVMPSAPPENLRLPERLELERLRSSAVDLELRRPRIGGPTSLVCIGVPLAALFTPLMVMQIDKAQNTSSDEILFGPKFHRMLAGMFGTLSIVGVGLAVTGVVWLSKRVHARRVHEREMEDLRRRIDKLSRSLDVAYLPTTRTLTLSLRF